MRASAGNYIAAVDISGQLAIKLRLCGNGSGLCKLCAVAAVFAFCALAGVLLSDFIWIIDRGL
jgi:hypothetical protein